MSNIRSKRIKKVLSIVVITLVILLILFVVAAAMLFRNYLAKIDYDHGDLHNMHQTESVLSDEEIQKELLEEEADTGESDSPEEIISQLEAQMEQQQKVDGEELESDLFHILLVGSDSRKQGGAGRSDTMILVSVNEETEKIHMTSILRDCYVSIPKRGNNRINAAYAFGGGGLLLDTIETNFAVDVDKYVAFDFYSFVDAVDSLGGIEIDVSEEEIPVLNEYVKELNKLNGRAEQEYYVTQAGPQQLNGTQALGYARIRYVGNGDFQRTERQRMVIQKLFEKAKTMNLLELNDLLNVLLPKIKTNLTEGEIVALMFKVMTYLKYDLESFRLPVDGSYTHMRVNGMSVLGIDLKKNQEALAEFVNE